MWIIMIVAVYQQLCTHNNLTNACSSSLTLFLNCFFCHIQLKIYAKQRVWGVLKVWPACGQVIQIKNLHQKPFSQADRVTIETFTHTCVFTSNGFSLIQSHSSCQFNYFSSSNRLPTNVCRQMICLPQNQSQYFGNLQAVVLSTFSFKIKGPGWVFALQISCFVAIFQLRSNEELKKEKYIKIYIKLILLYFTSTFCILI